MFSRSMAGGLEFIYIEVSSTHFLGSKTHDDYLCNSAKRRQRPGVTSTPSVPSFVSHCTHYLRALKHLKDEVQFTLVLLTWYKFLPNAKEKQI